MGWEEPRGMDVIYCFKTFQKKRLVNPNPYTASNVGSSGHLPQVQGNSMFDQIKRLLKHTIIYGSGGTSVEILRFFLIPVYTRYLSPKDYGILALIMVTSSLLQTIPKMGLSHGFFKYYSAENNDEGRKTVASTILVSLALISVCLTSGLFGFARSIASLVIGDSGSHVLFRVLFATIFFHILSSIPFQILRANENSLRFSILSFSGSLLGMVLSIFFVVVLKKGIMGILLGELISQGFVFIFLIPTVYENLRPEFSFRILRETMSYGFPMVVGGLLEWLRISADRFLLKRFLSLDKVGLYSLGLRFALPVTLAVNAFHTAWFPFIFSIEDQEDEKNIHSCTMTYFFFIASSLWLIMSITAKEIIGFMAAPAFRSAYKVVPLLAGMQVFYGMYYIARAGILLTGQTVYILVLLAVIAGMNIGLNWVLLPKFGTLGAGIVALLSNFALYLLTYTISRKLYKLHYQYRRILKMAMVALALYTISIVIPGKYLTALLLKLLIIFSYPFLLGIIGFYERSEISRVKLAGNKVLDSLRRMVVRT